MSGSWTWHRLEQDNPAVALYRRLGFVSVDPVGTVDGSITMVLDLGS